MGAMAEFEGERESWAGIFLLYSCPEPCHSKYPGMEDWRRPSPWSIETLMQANEHAGATD